MYSHTCRVGMELDRQSLLRYDALMVEPCPKCGATKTETGSHDLIYALAKLFGYRVRLCSRCQRRRFLPRHSSNTAEAAEESKPTLETPVAEVEKKPGDPDPSGPGCPSCGKVDYRRSHRRIWERLSGRGAMVRCRSCRFRFPRPEDAPPERRHEEKLVASAGREHRPRPHKSR